MERQRRKRMMKSRKNKRRRKNNNIIDGHESNKLTIISDVLNNDLLLEIFIRLPDDCRAVIRCSVVCKHWFSLINSIEYRNRKRQRYLSHSEWSLPCTFILRRDYFGGKIYNPFYEYLPQKSKILHGIIQSSNSPSSSLLNGTYLEFLPWRGVHILSTFNDLLLILPVPDPRYSPRRLMMIICNPFTRQWLELPRPPEVSEHSYWRVAGGLVCKPTKQQQQQLKPKLDQYRYRVVLLDKAYGNGGVEFRAVTFCSETREWSSELSTLRLSDERILNRNPPVACSGMLHWLDENSEIEINYRIVALDPFKDANHPKHHRFIDFPSDLLRGLGISDDLRLRLGVVRGQLRLSQIIKTSTDGGDHVLKVWELSYNNIDIKGGGGDDDDDDFQWTWTLVHHVEVKRWTKLNYLFVIAFHPDNGDVVFLLRCRHHRRLLYQYDILEDKMKKVCEIPPCDGDEFFPCELLVYTLLHPLWPTTLSALPSI